MTTIAPTNHDPQSPALDKKKSKKRKRPEEDATAGDGEGVKAKKDKKERKEKKEKKDKKEKKEKRDKKKKHEEAGPEPSEPVDERQSSPPPPPPTDPAPATPPSKTTKKRKLADPPTPPPEEDGSAPAGHSLILAKLRKSLARTAVLKSAAADTAEETPEVLSLDTPITATGLQPVPQPALPPQVTTTVSATSSLPQWLRAPITVSSSTTVPFAEIANLHPKLLQKLTAQQLTSAFAVQTAVLPLLLPGAKDGDVCISAATGSGKTLSYLLPVLQSVLPRVVVRLRAIIVVPTRELVTQVHSTLVTLSAGTGIKIGTAIGSRSLVAEQSSLVAFDDDDLDAAGNPKARSLVDVLITTPGRLVEHIRATPGFELQHLRWLVVDEADRLLAQSFQEWVAVVIGGIETAKKKAEEEAAVVGGVDIRDLGLRPRREGVRKVVLSATMTRDVGKLADLQLRDPTLVVVEASGNGEDGDAMAVDGKTVEEGDAAEESYTLPTSLREAMLPIEDGTYKPLALMYLITQHSLIKNFNPLDPPSSSATTTISGQIGSSDGGVLIFTRSNESATRLSALLTTVAPSLTPITGLITGEMPKKRREKQLKLFKKGECQLLICSDLISRGLDLPNVAHIINYDVPPSVQAYVHRVGRTARAGKQGAAWTLVERKEGRWFMNVIGGKGGKKEGDERGAQVKRDNGKEVERVTVVWDNEGEGVRGRYESVLEGGA